ncbi:TPA: major capsid protein, partial [Vibrio cholerae O1]
LDFYFHVSSAGVITDGAGTTVIAKPCGEVTCPPFAETRLEVNGVCVSVDILANVGYPELTSRTIEGVLVAHAKKMNSLRISTIQAAAGAAIAVPGNSTFLFNLDYLEWYAEAMRTSYSLAEGATVEVILPTWVKPLVRAELARRTGVEAWAVSDQQIMAYFSARNLSTQFVRDWQVVTGTPGAVSIPATM